MCGGAPWQIQESMTSSCPTQKIEISKNNLTEMILSILIVILTFTQSIRSEEVTCESTDDIYLQGVFLHGLGDSPKGWSFLKQQRFADVDWTLPSGTKRPITVSRGFEMNGWFDVFDRPIDSKSRDDECGILESVAQIHSVLDDMIEGGAQSENIFVGGFSQGGAVALLATYTYSKRLAGCICLSGWLQLRDQFSTLLNDANRDTPAFWGHGTRDPMVLVDTLETGVNVLDEHLTSTIDVHEYEGMKHRITTEEMQHLNEWIGSIRKDREEQCAA